MTGVPGTEAVWQELNARLRGFVSRRVRNAADADDVVQRVFLQIHRGLHDLQGPASVHAWVYRIARNSIVDYYRSPARRRELPSGDAQDLALLETAARLPDAPAGVAEAQQMAGCLSPMIERLPEAYRKAIVMTELEGQTQRAAAMSLGLSVSGMKSRVQRARQQLKAMILECCHVALDRRGAVIAHEPKGPACGSC